MNRIREQARALVDLMDTPLMLWTPEQFYRYVELAREDDAVAYARAYLRVLDALFQVHCTWNRHLESDQMHAALVRIERICEEALKEDE